MSGMALLLFAGVVVAGIPGTQSADEQVDLIELNHFFDEHGRHVFDQVIFYEWSQTHHRFHVKAWRLVKDPQQLPQKSWKPIGYRCVWHDDGVLRKVRSPAYRETWSQVDPERTNRQLLPQDQRIGLLKPVIGEPIKRPAPTEIAIAEERPTQP
ncbi:hypothetical protein CA51_38340 [Rosistilla oblonga]|uniref:hypothetical protein n=1 Tax=Rosistilla oblonga TaxID=2527990 RepID=UPI001189B8DF|nr:hypothetical protein [Rosistilla oblonga]QDV13942.1 hypothetical protein CA51_38340 [Rosistilla oblonga]